MEADYYWLEHSKKSLILGQQDGSVGNNACHTSQMIWVWPPEPTKRWKKIT